MKPPIDVRRYQRATNCWRIIAMPASASVPRVSYLEYVARRCEGIFGIATVSSAPGAVGEGWLTPSRQLRARSQALRSFSRLQQAKVHAAQTPPVVIALTQTEDRFGELLPEGAAQRDLRAHRGNGRCRRRCDRARPSWSGAARAHGKSPSLGERDVLASSTTKRRVRGTSSPGRNVGRPSPRLISSERVASVHRIPITEIHARTPSIHRIPHSDRRVIAFTSRQSLHAPTGALITSSGGAGRPIHR